MTDVPVQKQTTGPDFLLEPAAKAQTSSSVSGERTHQRQSDGSSLSRLCGAPFLHGSPELPSTAQAKKL